MIFKLDHADTKLGRFTHISGSSKQLGSWKFSKAQEMNAKGTYPRWQSVDKVKFRSKEELAKIEYKYVVGGRNSKRPIWEKGDNRKVDLSEYYDKGKVIVVEDRSFNNKDNKPNVYLLEKDGGWK